MSTKDSYFVISKQLIPIAVNHFRDFTKYSKKEALYIKINFRYEFMIKSKIIKSGLLKELYGYNKKEGNRIV